MKRISLWCAVLFMGGITLGPGGSGAQPVPGAEQIYVQAIAAMRALPRPESIAYTLAVTGSLHPRCDATNDHDGDIVINIGPTTQRNFAVVYYPGGQPARTEDLQTHEVCKGPGLFSPVPDLSPDYDKREDAKRRAAEQKAKADGKKREPDENGARLPGDDGLRYAVQDVRANYTIAVAYSPAIEGHNVFRLVFSPRRRNDPGEFPLREILVDAETSRIREIKYNSTFGNFAGDFRLQGDLKLGPVGDYWVVTDLAFSGTGRVLLIQKTFGLTEHAHDYVFLNRKQGSAKPN